MWIPSYSMSLWMRASIKRRRTLWVESNSPRRKSCLSIVTLKLNKTKVMMSKLLPPQLLKWRHQLQKLVLSTSPKIQTSTLNKMWNHRSKSKIKSLSTITKKIVMTLMMREVIQRNNRILIQMRRSKILKVLLRSSRMRNWHNYCKRDMQILMTHWLS